MGHKGMKTNHNICNFIIEMFKLIIDQPFNLKQRKRNARAKYLMIFCYCYAHAIRPYDYNKTYKMSDHEKSDRTMQHIRKIAALGQGLHK